MTLELVNYARSIALERGIKKEDMTPELMGEVLQEALKRMDKATSRFLASEAAQAAFAKAVYYDLPMIKKLEKAVGYLQE
jgi:ubiquinone biosynthesis protein COQ9